jgi:energy-coupling factor transport system substrate-specific component
MILCALHGLSFGTLYAPAHALMFGLSFQGMIAWIIAGLPFDLIHAAGNLAAGTMIVPLAALLKRLDKKPV